MFILRVFIFAPPGENKHTKDIEYHAAEHPELVEGQAKATFCAG
jgi:hypothetical protein